LKDLIEWWTKLKIGGLLCGNGFYNRLNTNYLEDNKMKRKPRQKSNSNNNIFNLFHYGNYSTESIADAVSDFGGRNLKQIQLTYDESELIWCIRK
jgi:hypothetical protein